MILKYPDLSPGSAIEAVVPSVCQQSLSGKPLSQLIFMDSILMSSAILLVTLNRNVAGMAVKVVEFAVKFLFEMVGQLKIVDSPCI